MSAAPIRILAAVLPALWAGAAPAQTVDPRALAACQAEGGSFVALEACLPGAHVGLITLDAIRAGYGAAGDSLAEACIALNETNLAGADVCAREAIQAAQKLQAMLPAGAVVEDPLFAGLADPALFVPVLAARDAAKAAFPEGSFGLVRYKALQ